MEKTIPFASSSSNKSSQRLGVPSFLGVFLTGSQKPQVVAGKENLRYSLEYFVFKRFHPQVLQKIPSIYLTVGGWLSYFGQNF
jgi:hypothetical protein